MNGDRNWKESLCTLVVKLIFVGTLNSVFIVKLVSAKDSEEKGFNYDFMEKIAK